MKLNRRNLFLASSATITLTLSTPTVQAQLYWDNNGNTAGFGTANGTWAAPTTGNSTQGWSGNTTGEVIPGNVTTTTLDNLFFGNGATGLGVGNITVSGSVSAGNMTYASGSGNITLTGGNLTLANTSVISVDGNSTAGIASIRSTITAGNLTKAGTGTLTLGGNNTYSGATTVNTGTLSITNSNALGTTAGATTINGTAAVTQLSLSAATGNLTIADDIRFAGNSLGRAQLTSQSGFFHTLSGAIDVSSDIGLVQFSPNAASVSIATAGGVTLSGDITGNMTGNMTTVAALLLRGGTSSGVSSTNVITGNITLTGAALTKTDANTWTIGGPGKTYSSSINQISAANGILRMGAANYLAPTTVVFFGTNSGSGGTLDLNGFDQTVAGIQLTGGTSGNKTITSSTAAVLTVDNAANNTTGSLIFLTGSLGLTKQGVGNLTLATANTHTGNTKVNAGILVLSNTLALQNSAYDTASINGGLDLTGFNTPTLGGLTGSGNLSSTLVTGYGSITDLILNPQLGITQTYSGDVVDGAAGMTLTKTGAGTQILSGNNTYTGNTTVTGGALITTRAAALAGYDSVGRVVIDGGTLGVQIGGSGWTEGQMLDLIGNATNTSGALGIDTINGNFTQVSAYNLGAVGLTKLGSGDLILTQANSYTGPTTIAPNGGTLQIDIATALPSGSQIVLTKTGLNTGTLKLNTSGTNVYNNTFGNFSSANSLVVGGSANIQNVQGNNTMSGDMILTAGGGNGVNIQSDAGLLTISGNLTQGTGASGTRPYTFGGAGNGVISGEISPFDSVKTPAIVKTGAGTWSITGTNNSFTGGVNVLDGVLNVASVANTGTNSSIGAGGPINFTGQGTSGTLQYTGSTAVTTDHALNVAPTGGTLDASGTGSGTLKLTGTFTASNAAGTNLTYTNGSNLATNTGSFTPGTVGGDVMTLNAATLPSGTTITSISGNVLTLSASANATGARATTFTDNVARTLTLTGSNTGANEISSNLANSAGGGTLSVSKTGTGAWVLSGNNTYAGNTTVNGGTLTLAGAANATDANPSNGNSTVTIAANATLNLTYSGTDIVDKLFIGGVQQPAGIYGPTGIPKDQITNSSGNGTLTVNTSPSGSFYTNWPGGNSTNFYGDANGDGVPNGMTWLLGGANTTSNGLALLPAPVVSGGNMTLTFKTPIETAPAQLSFQYGINLVTWSALVPVPTANGTFANGTFTVTPANATTNNVTLTVSGNASLGGGKLFGRFNSKEN